MLNSPIVQRVNHDIYSLYHQCMSLLNTSLDEDDDDSDPSVPDLNDEVLQSPDVEKDIFEYIVGAVCRKFNISSNIEKQPQNSLISIKGAGKLIQPKEETVLMCRKINDIFDSFNGSFLNKCVDPLGSVQRLIMKKCASFCPKVVGYFCRMKFFSRIKRRNIEVKLKKSASVRSYKQTAQFVN